MKKSNTIFKLNRLLEGDQEFIQIMDKAKIFFTLFSNCTVEIQEIHKVECPGNRVKFYEKAANLTALSKTVELYRCCQQVHYKLLTGEILYELLKDESNGRLFSLMKYAKTKTEGLRTFMVCDVLLGENIEVSDGLELAEGEPASFLVPYTTQILLKYVVNLKATKIAVPQNSNTYSDVPECLASKTDGVYQVDFKTFDFRNASHPMFDVVMKASILYDGACMKRKDFKQGRYNYSAHLKKDIRTLEVVICHDIWKKYEERKKEISNAGGKYKEIYAYHATAPHNVESIIKNNLDWRRQPVHGRAHGHSCYFSEYPEFSLKYNRECMFIFKLLLLSDQYKRYNPNSRGYCEQIIMWDDSLFKPVYVLYF